MSSTRGRTQSTLRLPIIGIFILALGLRLALTLMGTWSPDIIDSYDTIAHNMVAGKGFSFDGSSATVCRAPVYPAYLAVIFWLTGDTSTPYTLLRVIDAVVDALSAVFVVAVGRSWLARLGARVHLLAGILYAVNPFAIYFTVKLGTEALQTFIFILWLIAIAPLFVGTDRPPVSRIIIAGVISGILLLSKSVFLPIILLLPLVGLLSRTTRAWTRFLPLAGTTILALVILAPWTARNHAVSGRLIPIQTLAGYNFWYDFTHDENRNAAINSGDPTMVFTGGAIPLPDGRLYKPYAFTAREDAEADALLSSRAGVWIMNDPAGMAGKMLDNFLGFWYVVESPRKMMVAGSYSAVLIIAALFGFRHARRSSPVGATFLLLLAFSFAVLYSPALGVFRYSLITIPVFSLFAATFILSIVDGLRCRWINKENS